MSNQFESLLVEASLGASVHLLAGGWGSEKELVDSLLIGLRTVLLRTVSIIRTPGEIRMLLSLDGLVGLLIQHAVNSTGRIHGTLGQDLSHLLVRLLPSKSAHSQGRVGREVLGLGSTVL